MKDRKTLTVIAAILLMAACSGGGDGSPAPPPPVQTPTPAPTPPPSSNTAPVIEVDAQISLTESVFRDFVDGVFEVSDADDDTLSFELSGPDAARFSLAAGTSSPGASTSNPFALRLDFSDPIDFEAPGDANGDGLYEVTLSVSDGTDTTTAAASMSVRDARYGDDFSTSEVITGLNQPVQTVAIPGSSGCGAAFILEKGGALRYEDDLLNTGDEDEVALDLRGQISTDGEGGLLGLALSPDFETDRRLYINVTNASGETEIRRYRLFTNRDDLIDPSTEEVIIRIPQPFDNHNAGWIGFAADGTLLIPTGDGGGANDPENNAQDPFDLLGKVLRLDVSGDEFPGDETRNYRIPPGNPFADRVNGAPEVFALGFRNPYRANYDAPSNTLYIADVGQNAREEINALSLDTAAGSNFGWPLFEGLRPNRGDDETGLTPPIAEYAHGTGPGEGRSITGGFVSRLPAERDPNQTEVFFVFGDFISGNVWSLDLGKIPASGTLDADAFAEQTLDNPARRLFGFTIPSLTDVSECGSTMVMTTIDGRVRSAEFVSPPGN